MHWPVGVFFYMQTRRRRGWQRTRWLDGITDSMGMSLGGLRALVMDKEAWRAVCMGLQSVRHDGATELNGTFLYKFLFSRSVVSNSLWPHGLQHSMFPCPSPIPGACSNSSPLSQWGHLTIWSSVVPFSSRLNRSQHQCLFQWVSSSHQVASFGASASVLPMIFRTDFL